MVLANAEHVKAGLVSELCGCQDFGVTLDGVIARPEFGSGVMSPKV